MRSSPMRGRELGDMAQETVGFEDFLPSMAERFGANGLLAELCKGFRLLMDAERGVITVESLRRNAAALGLGGMGEEELLGMLREGDLDGDGVLDQLEFCVLMFRLSPELMGGSRRVLDEILLEMSSGSSSSSRSAML